MQESKRLFTGAERWTQIHSLYTGWGPETGILLERKKEGGKEDRVTLRKDYCRNGSGEGTGRWFGGRLRRRDGTFFLEHYHNEEAWTAVINNLVRTNMTTKETKSSSSAWEHTTSCVWITSHRNVFLHTNKFMQTGLRILLWGPARSWKWFCYPN